MENRNVFKDEIDINLRKSQSHQQQKYKFMSSVEILENSKNFKDSKNNSKTTLKAPKSFFNTNPLKSGTKITFPAPMVIRGNVTNVSNIKRSKANSKELRLHSKQELLLQSLIKFYEKDGFKNIIVPIVNQETAISLRLLDWLVTNYSKKYSVHYEIGDTKNESGYIPSNKNFNLWLDYKNQLKAYSKRVFDPFCRRQRVFFDTKNNKVTLIPDDELHLYEEKTDGIVTTVGQLNFFRWAITNQVIDYAFKNIEKIESDMLTSADQKAKKKGNANRVRRQLSKNNHIAKSQELKVIIQFP